MTHTNESTGMVRINLDKAIAALHHFVDACEGENPPSLSRLHYFVKDALLHLSIAKTALSTQPAKETVDYVATRLAQIASGDYKVCGHTAEQVAADALLALHGERPTQQPDPQFSNYQTDGGK